MFLLCATTFLAHIFGRASNFWNFYCLWNQATFEVFIPGEARKKKFYKETYLQQTKRREVLTMNSLTPKMKQKTIVSQTSLLWRWSFWCTSWRNIRKWVNSNHWRLEKETLRQKLSTDESKKSRIEILAFHFRRLEMAGLNAETFNLVKTCNVADRSFKDMDLLCDDTFEQNFFHRGKMGLPFCLAISKCPYQKMTVKLPNLLQCHCKYHKKEIGCRSIVYTLEVR